MYNIYVYTNNSGRNVYVRLHRQTISSLNESFHHELDKLTGRDSSETSSGVNSFLIRWGFCIIPSKETMSFAVEDADESRMYASLYALSQLWTMDYEVNCTRYGCVFVKGKDDDLLTGAHQAKSKSDGASRSAKCLLYLSLANPEPVWISKTKDGVIFTEEEFIKTGVDSVAGAVYFGRSSVRGGTPSRVSSIGGRWDMWYTASGDQEQSGELLRDTGHEFIRAKSGDPLPPHAVIVGMSDTHGSLYLGRVGGNIPCSISTNDDGRIKSFCYFSWPKEKRVERGEIMLLTGRN